MVLSLSSCSLANCSSRATIAFQLVLKAQTRDEKHAPAMRAAASAIMFYAIYWENQADELSVPFWAGRQGGVWKKGHPQVEQNDCKTPLSALNTILIDQFSSQV